jgi:hypothetical protein
VNKPELETRWIVLGTDGRHVSLARYTAPTQEEVTAAEAGLVAQGVAGWLTLMRGDYFDCCEPSLIMIRPLANPNRDFEGAVADFEKRRRSALSTIK